jgi:hypothetical protein
MAEDAVSSLTAVGDINKAPAFYKPALVVGALVLGVSGYMYLHQLWGELKSKMQEHESEIISGVTPKQKKAKGFHETRPGASTLQNMMAGDLGGLIKLGWVIPFSCSCAYFTGVFTQLDSAGRFGKADNTANAYLASLMGFLVVFRFNQLYSRVLLARQHLQNLTTALRTVASLVRAFWLGNMLSGDIFLLTLTLTF